MTLYTLMGIAAWRVWRQGGCEFRAAAGVFVVQLILNGSGLPVLRLARAGCRFLPRSC